MKKKIMLLVLCVAFCVGVMAGCGKSTEKENHLDMIWFGEAGTRNVEFFQNEFNEKIKEELGITISVEYLPWGAADQLQTMLASGDEIAFMMYGSHMNYVQKGYVAELDEAKINELCPDLLDARNGLDFSSASYQDKIYILPVGSQVFSGAGSNFLVRNDILNQVDWDYTDIKTYDDLMKACAAVHEAFPTLVINGGVKNTAFMSSFGKGQIWGVDNVAAVDETDPESDTVFNYFETEFFANYCREMKKWYDLGYTPDNASFSDSSQWNAGNALLRYGESKGMIEHTLAGVEGADVQYLVIDDNPNAMIYNFDWGWALSKAASDKADILMRLMNWIYASKDNYMFALYGVEGVDWEYAEDGSVNKLTDDLFFYDWQFKSFKYMDSESYDAEDWERYTSWDSKAYNSKKTGFVFDKTAVQAQDAAINAVVTEYVDRFCLGYENYDEMRNEFLDMLKEAGLEDYLAEYQKQFSEFMKNK